jgi:hypothetical protein
MATATSSLMYSNKQLLVLFASLFSLPTVAAFSDGAAEREREATQTPPRRRRKVTPSR